MSAIVTLDVGGEIIKTRQETLTKYPDTMLAKMFEHVERGLSPMQRTDNGDFFLDFDPDDFKVILRFLRLGGDKLDATSLNKNVLELADYLGLKEIMVKFVPKTQAIELTFNYGLFGEQHFRRKYWTTRSAVEQFPDTRLAKHFRGEEETLADVVEISPGRYFVNRGYYYSEAVFCFLNQSTVEFSPRHHRACPWSPQHFEAELLYYGFRNGTHYRAQVKKNHSREWIYNWLH